MNDITNLKSSGCLILENKKLSNKLVLKVYVISSTSADEDWAQIFRKGVLLCSANATLVLEEFFVQCASSNRLSTITGDRSRIDVEVS